MVLLQNCENRSAIEYDNFFKLLKLTIKEYFL